MNSTTDQSKKQRRLKIKQEALAWLSQQPNLRVLDSEFRKKVGDPNDVQSLLASRDFAVFEMDGKRWITTQTVRAEDDSKQAKKQRRVLLQQNVLAWLADRVDQMATMDEFRLQFGAGSDIDSILANQTFVIFDYHDKRWLQSRKYHEAVFQKKLAQEERERQDIAWQKCIPSCGDILRPGGSRGKSGRLYVIARTYTPEQAAKRLDFDSSVLRAAVENGDVSSFIDPNGKIRIPADYVERALHNDEILELISGNTIVKVRQISLVAGISYSTARNRLIKSHLSTTAPRWKQIRGQWGLPTSLKEFRAVLAERYPVWLEATLDKKSDKEFLSTHNLRQVKAQAHVEADRLLRQQLIEVFPTWDRDRTGQHIMLHAGPTNSGKTFGGLNHLAAAGSGWYLAPLRLLAHEVFETLNKRDVPCSLLTGEESIDVPGAQITAATIEMFNARRSGKCVVIDEAHMLADEQRGWAWTRAIMEATAPDIHVMGSLVSEALIYRLAQELGIEISTEHYERLTPLNLADHPWSLETLPARTILVAFSRKMVLGLKADLEKKFNRSVAVIYGNLPPEVRLRQAERFASGEAEICVATDAIGMGLNLPADNVCFFEIEKFDGKKMRMLNQNEIQQIAGRAGRYGLSDQGKVSALSKTNLNAIRHAIQSVNTSIGFAYIAPTSESIALLPGVLEQKLRQWVTLKAIPERWRKLLKPVDLSEQIVLAGMLTPADVRRLGEESALQLINAPCANNTEPYWLACARAIIKYQEMPLPAGYLPQKITNTEELESYELKIRCADIYLWLAQRKEFSNYAPAVEVVRHERRRLSEILDSALAAKIDTTRRCRSCGRPLPLNNRYNLCGQCYSERFYDSH